MKKEIIEINQKAEKEKNIILSNIMKLNALSQFKELVLEIDYKNEQIMAENQQLYEDEDIDETEEYDIDEYEEEYDIDEYEEEYDIDEYEEEQDYTEQEKLILEHIEKQDERYPLITIFDYIIMLEDEENKKKAYNSLEILFEETDLTKILKEIEKLLHIIIYSPTCLRYDEVITQKLYLTETVLNILEQWNIDSYLMNYNVNIYNSNKYLEKIANVLGYNNTDIPRDLLKEVYQKLIENEEDEKIKLGYKMSYTSKLLEEKVKDLEFKINPEQMQEIVKMFIFNICDEYFYETSEVIGCFSEKISSKNKDDNDRIQSLIKTRFFNQFIKEQSTKVLSNKEKLETDTYIALLINSAAIRDGDFFDRVLETNEILDEDKISSEDMFKLLSVLFYIENIFSETLVKSNGFRIDAINKEIRAALYTKRNNREYTNFSIQGKNEIRNFLNSIITFEKGHEHEEDIAK